MNEGSSEAFASARITSQPKSVTTGTDTLRIACTPTVRKPERPFARAVWTYGCASSSSMEERTIITIRPIVANAIVTAGRIRWSSPPFPDEGRTPSQTAKM